MCRKNVVGVVVVALVIGMVGACKKKGVLVGSCDRRSSDAPRSVCEDAYDGKDGPTLSGCEIAHGAEVRGGKKSDAACDHSTAVAGCKFSNSIEWYYPSKRVKSPGNVASVCLGTLLGPDAKELTGVAKVELETDDQLSAEEDLAQWKSDIEAKLATIEKIGKSLPPPTTKVKAGSGTKEKFLTIEAADLPNIAANADIAHRDPDSVVLAQCARMVRKNDMTGIAKPTEPLTECHDAKWAVVQRTVSVREPAWLESGTNRDAYKGGHAQGDLLIYDLATGTLIGASPWSADSSRDFNTTWEKAKKDMAIDFAKQIASGLTDALFKAEGRKAQ